MWGGSAIPLLGFLVKYFTLADLSSWMTPLMLAWKTRVTVHYYIVAQDLLGTFRSMNCDKTQQSD